MTPREIKQTHEEFLDNIRSWNDKMPCRWCGEHLGKRYSPVTSGGFWFHYECCRLFLERSAE